MLFIIVYENCTMKRTVFIMRFPLIFREINYDTTMYQSSPTDLSKINGRQKYFYISQAMETASFHNGFNTKKNKNDLTRAFLKKTQNVIHHFCGDCKMK